MYHHQIVALPVTCIDCDRSKSLIRFFIYVFATFTSDYNGCVTLGLSSYVNKHAMIVTE